MPQTPFDEPAGAPLISGPVTLMRLVEVREIDVILDHMARLGLGPENLTAETKFNGWLIQSPGGHLWTRRGKEDITWKFPEIAQAVAPFDRDHLVGELVYVNPKGVMEAPAVTRIAGTDDPDELAAKRAALPGSFEYILFDALALDGHDVSQLPAWQRQEALREALRPEPPVRISPVHPFAMWEDIFNQGLTIGADGVVIKNAQAPYIWRPLGEPEPRPVANQYKFKPFTTDEFVVYETTRGPKGRLVLVFGQYHKGRLVPVGQVSNLARSLDCEVLERMAKGPFLVELKFQGRFPDPPGALQHARFIGFRDDKELTEALLPERFAP